MNVVVEQEMRTNVEIFINLVSFFGSFHFFSFFFFLVVWLSLAEMKLYLEPPAPLKINKC